ncbi:hypothetical protein GGR54DRAFT_189856 [Hypoxylon sp. NC1633]|nr:hypothetical protein GGR54DRAFT_189856 [Hypoxylon sp. NC1633]
MIREILAGLWLLPLVYAAPLNTRDIKSILTNPDNIWAQGTTISFSGSDVFTNATNRWTITDAPTFSAAISPINEEDVVAAVKLATSNGIPLLATGKRHGYTTTLAEMQQGLAIDLTQLSSYVIDKDAGTITLGGSTGIGDIQDAVAEAGFMIQSGSGSCPGYVGLTVGAGVGRYMGYFGLVMDGLISARVVTADAEVLEVSDTQNQDLFWAIRGAGANFGIITSATYKLHKMADNYNGQILNADIYFAPNETDQYFKYLESIGRDLPGNVAGIHLTSYNDSVGSAQLLANWVWIGTEEDGREFMSQFLDLNPTSANIQYLPWNKLIGTAAGGFNDILCEKDQYRNFYTANLLKLDGSTYQETFEKMTEFYNTYPDAHGSFVNLEVFPNQATAAVDHDSTAYPWRDTKAYIQVGILVGDEHIDSDAVSNGETLARGLRDSWVKTSGYSEISIYVNYAHGDEELWQKYGRDKLPRLSALKKQWDPTNVFGFNNALPTSWGNSTSKRSARMTHG